MYVLQFFKEKESRRPCGINVDNMSHYQLENAWVFACLKEKRRFISEAITLFLQKGLSFVDKKNVLAIREWVLFHPFNHLAYVVYRKLMFSVVSVVLVIGHVGPSEPWPSSIQEFQRICLLRGLFTI